MPTSTMTTYADHLDRDGAAIAAAAAQAGLSAPVPSCPAWTVTHLLNHVERACQGIGTLVERGITEVKGQPPLPRAAGGDPLDDFREQLAFLVGTLRATPADRPVWTWSGDDRTVTFWARRMALDVTVHRWDAQLAAGAAEPIDAELAADGVAEFFDVFLSAGIAAGNAEAAATTLRFEFTDGPEPVERNLGLPADEVTLVRGPASEVLLALWHRRPFGDLVISGDRTLLDAWQPIPSGES